VLAGVGPSPGQVPAPDPGPAVGADILLVDVARPAVVHPVVVAGGDDAPHPDPVAQHALERLPQVAPLRGAEGVARAFGVDAVHEERLGPVDVPDPRHDGLVHQGHTERSTPPGEAGRDRGRVGVPAQRVRPEPGDDTGALLGPEDLAGRRAGQVVTLGCTDEADPHLAVCLGPGRDEGPELAVQPEMDVQEPLGLEAVEEVLAPRFDAPQLVPVEQRSPFAEPALGRAHSNRLTDEGLRLIARDAMDGVAFGHVTEWSAPARYAQPVFGDAATVLPGAELA
jgi:hypothetical protein